MVDQCQFRIFTGVSVKQGAGVWVGETFAFVVLGRKRCGTSPLSFHGFPTKQELLSRRAQGAIRVQDSGRLRSNKYPWSLLSEAVPHLPPNNCDVDRAFFHGRCNKQVSHGEAVALVTGADQVSFRHTIHLPRIATSFTLDGGWSL